MKQTHGRNTSLVTKELGVSSNNDEKSVTLSGRLVEW